LEDEYVVRQLVHHHLTQDNHYISNVDLENVLRGARWLWSMVSRGQGPGGRQQESGRQPRRI